LEAGAKKETEASRMLLGRILIGHIVYFNPQKSLIRKPAMREDVFFISPSYIPNVPFCES
jgi:hypothetical protein